MIVKCHDDRTYSLGAGGAGRGRGERRRAGPILLGVGFFVRLLVPFLLGVRIRVVLAIGAVISCTTCKV